MARPWTSFGWALGASAALHALVLARFDPAPVGTVKESLVRPPMLTAWLEPLPSSQTLPQTGVRSRAPHDPLEPPRRKPPRKIPSQPRAPEPSPEKRSIQAQWLPTAQLGETLERLSEVLLYPPEALRRGLEGEVVLLVELGEGGRIVGASVASSSGHPLLDEAALKAVGRLDALNPASAGKAILLPVRFKIL